MKTMILLSAIFAISLSTLSFASTEVGNGGDVVSCDRPGGKTAELLDYYEARSMYGLKNLLNPAASVEENLKFLLSTFAKSEPERAQQLSGWADTFFKEAAIMPGVELVDIDDSKHLAFPVGCKVEQIIIQKDVEYSFDKRYVINKDLWDLLDNVNRAGLVFHELLYRDAIAHHGLQNGSRTLRLVNGLVASDQFQSVEPVERVKIWEEFRFEDVYINGIQMDLQLVVWSETKPRALLKFRSAKTQFMQIPHGSIELRKNSEVDLYPSGAIKKVDMTRTGVFPQDDGSLIYDGQMIKFRDAIEFYENGTIKSGWVDHLTAPSKKYGTLQCLSTIINNVSLYEDGNIKSCRVNIENYSRRFTSDRYDVNIEIEKNQYIPSVNLGFDEQGYINSVYSDSNTPAKISGTYPIQGAPREVTSLYVGPARNYQLSRYPVNTVATIKNQETFRVRGVNIEFSPGEVTLYSDGVIASGTLAKAVNLEINAVNVANNSSVIPIAPYATCGLFGTKSRPVPTFFEYDGKVRMGAVTYPVALTVGGFNTELSGGDIFSSDGYVVRDEHTSIYWETRPSNDQFENYCN